MKINLYFYKNFVPKHHKNATFVQLFNHKKYLLHSLTISVQVGRYAYQMVAEWRNRNPEACY